MARNSKRQEAVRAGPVKGKFIAPPEELSATEVTPEALPRQEEFWRPPVRFGSIPVEKEPLEWDRRRGFRKLFPAVILRKAGQSNRSEQGAATQSVLMTVFRTLKLRGLDPIATVTDALRTYVQTGEIPPLPQKSIADG